ncbi:synaptic vesicle glycoprotein 2C-like [Danaus plexippus]|uniref:synaptic vesicle glycoprotein 2C-like n=1 Tax=Danaus plexippus TaxID=13037 RepID=UPI002AB1D472|nr:synaptic vesicle glycoprotein 2C-like [Danaus plexippus]
MEEDSPTPFEDALERTGNGRYNYLLAATCGLVLLGMGTDMFGFGLVVAAACDLNITVTQKGILTSLPFIGILLVSYVWGYISDTRGRRFSLIISVQAGFLLSCLASITTNWLFLAFVKFFSVCFSCAINSVAYTLVGESCVQRVRSKYMLMMTCFVVLSPGIAALLTYPTLSLNFESDVPFLGIKFTPWRLLMIVLAIPMGIGGVIICYFHESPKFLINVDRQDEALEVLRSIYAINNRNSSVKSDLQVKSIYLEDSVSTKEYSLLKKAYEQSAPLFRPPLLWRTCQLFFIVSVIYFTNNSLLVWLPYVLNMLKVTQSQTGYTKGDVCTLISVKPEADNFTMEANHTKITPDICLGYIEDNVIITLVASAVVYSFLNFALSYLMRWRRLVLISILVISALSGALLNLMPEPISSVFLFMAFSCTNQAMGIMAAYFVEFYPTSCRGMACCLSIMVGRTSTFVGINVVGNLIFHHCHITFYIWSLVVFSSAIAAWFLPHDKPLQSRT